MMKAKPYLFAALACLFMGCEMAEVVEWGADCPTDASLSLTYIGNSSCTPDNASACQLDGKTYNFSTNFDIRRCPKEYSVCKANKEDGNYHCEKDTKKGCADTQITCPRSDGTDDVDCIDPASLKTCGATSCESPGYGGQDCSEYGELSRCQYDDESKKYSCRCPNGALLCGKQCIDPNDAKTCGANDCDADNYGGTDCTAGKNLECQEDDRNQFSCQCRKDFILCDDTCINPSSDQKHCGAKGTCSGSDPESSDYAGENCESGDSICSSGKCACTAGQIWCVPDGSDSPRCVSPGDNETCGAHLSEDGIHCEANPCQDLFTCQINASEEYECQQSGCEENEQFCMVNEEKKCVSKYSTENCGHCNNDCKLLNYAHASVSGCEDNEGSPMCTFTCDEGYENCGSSFSPKCIDLKTSQQNCGKCENNCEEGLVCSDGSCSATVCQPNECMLNGSSCVNNDSQCGVECKNCKAEDPNAFCQNGACIITSCPKDTHPVFKNSQIVQCASNTVNACGKNTMTIHDSPEDCTKIGNAAEVNCLDSACIVVNCQPGYHLNKSKTACEANSNEACGATNSNSTVNCSTTITNSVTTACSGGSCTVSKCKDGHHLNATKTGCEANSDTSCGAIDSTTVQDCTSIANSNKVSCQAGKCTVSECKPTYHLNSSKTGCEANSKTSCAKVGSNAPQDCTKIANSSSVACTDGECVVSQCAGDYHLNSNKTGCAKNSTSSCAAANSNTPKDCTGIDNIANSSSVSCSSGKCAVSKCKSGYHLSSDKTKCDKNSNTSCAATDSNKAKDCTAGIEKVCVSGVCQCSKDNSTVLNYDKTACVHIACKGVPGIAKGRLITRNWYDGKDDYICDAVECVSGYKRQKQSTADAWSCRPKESKYQCIDKMGYKYTDDEGYCIAMNSAGTNGHSMCKSGYRHYIYACLPQNVCCGKLSNTSDSYYFQCTNCLAQGKTCNTTSGECK